MSSTGGDSQNTEKSSEMKSNSSNLTDLNSPSKMLSTSSSGGYTTPVKAVMDSTSSTSGYTTPIKGSFTPSSRSQASGSGFRSPSFSSPSSKGQGEDLVGYLVTVGPIQKSRKNNYYYLLQMHVAKLEIIAITIMVDKSNPPREVFLPYSTLPMKLSMVYPGDGGYFFYKSRGSTFEVTDELTFTIDDLMTPLKLLQTKKSGKYHIKGMLRWLGEVEMNKNGGIYRWALLGDVSGSIKLKVWKEEWFQFSEQTVFLMTNLQVIDYFGVYLSTVFDSAFSTSVEEIVPSWPADFDSMVTKLETKTILSAEINSVAISTSAFCPACKHDIDGEFLECNPCNRTFKSRKCKFHLSGTIEVEGIEDGAACTVEVNVDSANIDQMFGEGTVRRYGRNIKELKHRLLQQENMEITYVPETKKITMITIEQSIPEKMKKDNDDNG